MTAGLLQRIRSRIAQASLGKKDLAALAKKGRYVLSLCTDKKAEHHLPLLDPEAGCMNPDNWDLQKDIKKKVSACLDELFMYADAVSRAYLDEQDIRKELLPPWLVFPAYSAGTIGWRMGPGEEYEIIWNRMLKNMSEDRYRAYREKYPAPGYMRKRSGY